MKTSENAAGVVRQDGQTVPFLAPAKSAVFHSKRPALQRLIAETALGKTPAQAHLPIETLVSRAAATPTRFTPAAARQDEEPRFSIFRTVGAMRRQQVARSRP